MRQRYVLDYRLVAAFVGACALIIPANAAVLPGTIPARFEVGDQGDARYSVPIETPAATGGLRPNLALTYNHLAGSGLAGMRWTLTGVSAITRCSLTYAQDGAAVALAYATGDKFCLDGKRLVQHSGNYGDPGAQYRTEIDTFQKITQESTQGSGPLQFRVDHGNGSHSYYGATADSRIEAPGKGGSVRTWYLSYTEDQFQNRITYYYDENTTTGEAVPFRVVWTSNALNALSAFYRVEISYEARPADDQRSGHDAAGAPWSATKRIDRIDVIWNGTAINTYDLSYGTPSSTGTGRSQLQSVTRSRGADSLPSTVFTVQNGTRGWSASTSTGQSVGSNPLAGDMNNDGRQDLFVCLSGLWHVHLGQADGQLGAAFSSGASCATTPSQARVVDFNGDGSADLLYPSLTDWFVLVSQGTWLLNTATGITTASMSNPSIQDVDGDGLGDVIFKNSNGVVWMRSTGSAFVNPLYLFVPAQTTSFEVVEDTSFGDIDSALDFNGDGRTDPIVRVYYCATSPPNPPVCVNQYYVLRSTGGSGFTELLFATTADGSYLSNFRSLDVNGDGLQDFMYVAPSGWVLHVSGGATIAASTNLGISTADAGKAMIVDYDSDGRDDLVRVDASQPNSYLIHRSNGTTIPASYTDSLASSGAHSATAFVADVSGEGFREIVRTSAGIWATHKHASALPDVVTTFTDGLGNATDVVYEPLANYSQYYFTGGAPPTPYLRKYRGSRHVVTQERHDNGLSGPDTEREITHVYNTAHMDVSGRGWLSFWTHDRYDGDGRTFVHTEFNQSWPFSGMVEVAWLGSMDTGQTITRVDPLLDKTTWTSTTPNRHFVRVESTETREYEIGGIANGQHVRTILENPAYDTTYGHVTNRTTTTTDVASSKIWTSATSFNPTVDLDDWCLGQPGLVETTNTLPSSVSAVRRVRYVWNSNDCSLTQTTDESDVVQAKQLRTAFTYDSYGNPNVVSQDSVDLTAQDRSTDFDFDGWGQWPTKVAVGTVNLDTLFTWNYTNGQRASVTSPDSLQTTFLYHPFGSLNTVMAPGPDTTVTNGFCSPSCWAQNAVYYSRSQRTDGSDDYEYFDKLGRSVGRSWKLPLGTEGRQSTRYDKAGRVTEVSQPYVFGQSVYSTVFTYDVLGRLTREDAPRSEAQPSGAHTDYDYRGVETWVTRGGEITKYVYNGRREIERVTDASNGQTNYTYKPFGELESVTDAESQATTISYDPRGFKSGMTDPNMGQWAYEYNLYGELAKQKSPVTTSSAWCAGPGVWTVCLAYDEAGRLKTRQETEGTTTWSYYSAGTGQKGRLDTVTGPGHGLKYTYSSVHGEPTQVRHTLDGTHNYYDLAYDDPLARLEELTYPTSTSGYRFKVNYDYDTYGHLTVAKDGTTPFAPFYTLTQADALGRELTLELGSGANRVYEQWDYDLANGRLDLIRAGKNFGTEIQNLSFTFDEVGNLETRTNANIARTETFHYDPLDRLDDVQVGGGPLIDLAYSASGRITSKTGVGSYTYTGGSCGGGPYAVKSAGGQSFCYDAAGRMTSRGGHTLTWSSFDLPTVLRATGNQSAELSYGVDRSRYKQVRKTGSTVNATILYIGALLERETAGGTTTWRHYVSARGRTVAQVNRVGSTNTVQYLHRDHQGSVVEVTSSAGTLVQSLAYDAWGLRRNPTTWAALATPFAGTQPTERGYTGHEHLDTVELVHMNGRVQDPKLGVFISADPLVQAPYFSQSLNRYAYVWNNPGSLVDPSGFYVDDYTVRWDVPMSFGLDPEQGIAGAWRPVSCTEFGEHLCQAIRDVAASGGTAPTQGDQIVGRYRLEDFDVRFQQIGIVDRPKNTIEAAFQRAIMKGDVAELRALIKESGHMLGGNDLAIAQRASSAMESLGAEGSRALTQRYGVDFANRIGHVFENNLHDHGLQQVVSRFGGSQARAFLEIQRQLETASVLPRAGQFSDVIVNVGGQNVAVRGAVVDGVAKISTVFVP